MKKKFLFVTLFFISVFVLVGCGSTNKLVGTWKGLSDGESRDMQIEATFDFKKDNVVEYSNEFGIKSSGTYEIKDDKVTINLEVWDKEKVYSFKVDGNKLSLIATDSLSPSYSEMIKQ